MESPAFRFEPLGDEHDRSSFHCGEEPLDRYFRTQVTQDTRRPVTNCFVVVEVAKRPSCRLLHSGRRQCSSDRAASRRDQALTAISHSARLFGSAASPWMRIIRARPWRRHDERSSSDSAGRRRRLDLLVDAKNDPAVAFYERHGFRALAGQPHTLPAINDCAKGSAEELSLTVLLLLTSSLLG